MAQLQIMLGSYKFVPRPNLVSGILYQLQRTILLLQSAASVTAFIMELYVYAFNVSMCGVMNKNLSYRRQRNSASAAHMEEGARSSSPPTATPPVATPMHMAESDTRNKRTSSAPATKRTLR